jgi:protein involved in polysaccharide export with SLBB domain
MGFRRYFGPADLSEGKLRGFVRFAFSLACIDMLLWLSAMGAAAAETTTYVLGAGDVIRVSVYERSDLSGEFLIRSNGTIMMPIVGAVTAANLTIEQVEAAVAAALRAHALAEANAIVEPVSLRPFFIIGDVTNQGKYSYFPGMRVIEAIALAGGYRTIDTAYFQVRNDLSKARADFEVLTNEYRTDLARKARLEAERDGLSDIAFSDEMTSQKDNPAVADLLDSERKIFQQRKESLESQAKHIEAQKAQFQKESASLDAVMQAHATQISLLKPQVDAIQKLVDKGNALRSQLLDLQITYANVESLRLEASVNSVRAKERFSELDAQLASAESDRRADVLAQLHDVQHEIPDVLSRLAAAKDLLFLAGELAKTDATTPAGPRVDPTIIRTTANGPTEVQATEDTPVLPGDVIKVPIQ